jgi:hypothetical protein
MVCEIEADRLRARGHHICDMLTPLAGSLRLAYNVVPNRSQVMIGVHSGSPLGDDIRDWRFSTVVRGIRAGYHERWIAVDEKRLRFYIERAYLHLYRRRLHESEETQVIALHCDPNEPDDSGIFRHSVYKRGPHVHVTAAQQPFQHSHLALNAAEIDEVLHSLESLDRALISGIGLLRDQVLDVLDHYGL